MNKGSTRISRRWRYVLWSLVALTVLISLCTVLSRWILAAWRPNWMESDDMTNKFLAWSVAAPILLVAAGWGWSPAEARTVAAKNGPPSAATPAATTENDASRSNYVLEVIGLGVTLDKYRQGKLWEALSQGNAHASIREQDPKKYPWAADEKIGQSDTRSGNTLENGARSLPLYFGIPVFTASSPVHNDTYREGPNHPMVGTDGAEQVGMSFHLFVAAGSRSEDQPDQILDRVFSFFDQYPDAPYVVLWVDDGISPRDDYRAAKTPSFVKDGYHIPEMPDSSALFVLARRDRVDRIRPFAFDDFDPDEPGHVNELNRKGFARRLFLAYLNLSKRVPKRAEAPQRTPTVPEWLEETKAFTQRDDIYPKHVSYMDSFHESQHPSKDFKPSPWFPIPWSKAQLATFDQLPTLGFIHRPVFVKTVDEHGQPLSRRDARAAALAAGWQEALKTLPESERKTAPARVVTGSGGNIDQTIALNTVLGAWAREGGPELDTAKPTKWIDTDARLGNTGAATWFMQMAIGVMGSYKDGGTSVAINLRDPREASIVFISPPSDDKRKTQHNAQGGDVWRSIVGPAVDLANYQQP